MADEADISQDRLEMEDAIRRKYMTTPKQEVKPTGRCLNCGDKVPKDHRWCDVFCRNDWENRK